MAIRQFAEEGGPNVGRAFGRFASSAKCIVGVLVDFCNILRFLLTQLLLFFRASNDRRGCLQDGPRLLKFCMRVRVAGVHAPTRMKSDGDDVPHSSYKAVKNQGPCEAHLSPRHGNIFRVRPAWQWMSDHWRCCRECGAGRTRVLT